MMYGFSELSATPLYAKYLQFRHRVFNVRLGYQQVDGPVSTFAAFPALQESGVEFDGCDIPSTIHMAYVNAKSVEHDQISAADIVGCVRMLPTDGHYMVRDAIEFGYWENVPLLEPLPRSGAIYEASRIAVSPDLALKDPSRKLVLDNLVYGNIELAARLGIEAIVGIMHRGIWRIVYESRGIAVRFWSKPFRIDGGHPVLFGALQVTPALFQPQQHLADELADGRIAPVSLDDATFYAHQQHVLRAKNIAQAS